MIRGSWKPPSTWPSGGFLSALPGAFFVVALIVANVSAPAASEFAGSEMCLTCHEEAAQSLGHRGSDAKDPRCESCHGPGLAHIEGEGDASKIVKPGSLEPAESAKLCLSCHEKGGARHWNIGVHESADLTCLSCHKLHNPEGTHAHLLSNPAEQEVCFTCHKMQRVQTMRSSHMPVREGKLVCSDCHNPHGSTTEGMLSSPSVNDNCYRCHAEKRGPTLFEHPPVRENCLNCHDPHGSIHESLLVSKVPRLCQNCHINSRHPSEPRVAASRFVFNKGCVNCHTNVHGSNHPAGIRQQR